MSARIPVRLAEWYLNLAPVTPPDYYEVRKPLQRARMEYESEVGAEGFHRLFDLDFAGKDVLDLGCGYGGRTVFYKERGANLVAGVEVAPHMVEELAAFAQSRGVAIDARVGVGERLPFAGESFDIITSYDVLEHVESVGRTLAECLRVLRPGGILYAAFPPYYHPTGGSHLHGYISRSPAPNILFSSATLREAIELIQDERGSSNRPARRPTDPLPSVNGITVSGFFQTLRGVPFSQKRVRLQPLKHHRLRVFQWIPAIGVRIPMVREICTSRILCQLTK